MTSLTIGLNSASNGYYGTTANKNSSNQGTVNNNFNNN